MPRCSNPAQEPQQPAGQDTAAAIFKARKIPLLAAGVVALGCGIYLSMMVSSFARNGASAGEDVVPTGRPSTFTRESAIQFDRSLDASEKSIGITALRRDMGERAVGHVLEVALGTGRNMSFYNWSAIAPMRGLGDETVAKAEATSTPPSAMASFTGIDVSADMIGVAIEKLSGAVPGLAGAPPTVTTSTSQSSQDRRWGMFSYLAGQIRIFQCDAQEAFPPPSPRFTSSGKYDTIVQTFGLCSVADPERVVCNLAAAVKPGTGRIILVEHGRGWWDIVNTMLDWSASSHFHKYGCWWNRDIVGIVKNAAKSCRGLKVLRIERPFITQLGTTIWVELQVEEDASSSSGQ